MAKYPFLASHIFDTFALFKDWIAKQSFSIQQGQITGPVLKSGQHVLIRDTASIYNVIKNVERATDIFDFSDDLGYKPSLKEGQDFINVVFAPATPRLEIHNSTNKADISLHSNEFLITQNTNITLEYSHQGENVYRPSYIQVLEDGGVKLNVGSFITLTFWKGNLHSTYRQNDEFNLSASCYYMLVMQNEQAIHLIEVSRNSLDLSQTLPILPSEASEKNIPSEKAIVERLYEFNQQLELSTQNSNFFIFSGINPEDNSIIRVKEGEAYIDPYLVENSIENVPQPTANNLYVLTLRDGTHVDIYKSKELVAPLPSENPKYLGEGNYGLEHTARNIRNAYPTAKADDIVGELDTGFEWIYDGTKWVQTEKPAGDSKYVHNNKYLGVYDIASNMSIQNEAIKMVFATAEPGTIINNLLTNTKWRKISDNVWEDTGEQIVNQSVVANDKIKGVFAWSSSAVNFVKLALGQHYSYLPLNGDMYVGVSEGNDWVIHADDEMPEWSDTETPAGTHARIVNPRYFGSDSYGTGDAANNYMQSVFTEPEENDAVGNLDTNTDWRFNGDYWEDTNEPIGTFDTIPNPQYVGDYIFSPENENEVSAMMMAAYPDALEGDIIKFMNTDTEWKLDSGYWYDTRMPIGTAPDEIITTVENRHDVFNYLAYWTPPEKQLSYKFANAKFGDFVFNLSTGTEWEYSRYTASWIDTKRAIGTTDIENNSHYCGTGEYGTNPPTDTYILDVAFPDADVDDFVTNNTTGTQWKKLVDGWVNTKGNELDRWAYDSQGSYEWEELGYSAIKAGSTFHITSRSPETDRTEVYWYANSWNYIDFDSKFMEPFTLNTHGVIKGSDTFGYIEPEIQPDGDTVGHVVGLTNTGDGNSFLNNAGQYISIGAVIHEEQDLIDIYVDFDNGDDGRAGLSDDTAWKTFGRVKVYLATAIANYEYEHGTGTFPYRVTVHLTGENSDGLLVVENTPYLHIIGPGIDDADNTICSRLHIVDSSVTIENMKMKERLVAWKSKVQISGPVICQGIESVESSIEQKAKIYIPNANSSIPVLNFDEKSLFYHMEEIATEANINTNTVFFNMLGTYIKGESGTYTTQKPSNLRGTNFHIGSLAKLIGVDLDWLYANIPYEENDEINYPNPVAMPVIRSLYGTEKKTGYQIADGTDIADLFNKGNGYIIVETYEDALAIPIADRFKGLTLYIQQLDAEYWFKSGVNDANLERKYVPHYQIIENEECCCEHGSAWISTFPTQIIDKDGFITQTDQTEYQPVGD